MKPIITWIVIADGGRARILANAGPGKGLTAVEGLAFEAEHLKAQDIMADKPGRSFASAGHGRSAIEPHTDPVAHREAEFVRGLADILQTRHAAGAFQRLVLVAAPAALGDMRTALSAALRQLVLAEIPKDLTKIPNTELHVHINDVLAV